MKIISLISGSTGNCTYVETTTRKILIDLGSTTKQIKEKLEQIKIKAEEINDIIITHSHADHTSALKTFLNKYNPTIHIKEETFQEVECLKEYKQINIINKHIILEDTNIETINLSHDSANCIGLIIEEFGKTIVYLTDTGYLNKRYINKLKNKEVYFIESNHDVEMLLNGPYPEYLIRRVIGPKGHLSNKDTALYLTKLIGEKTKEIVLLHLSEKNNTEEKTLETIAETFKEYELSFHQYSCAKPKEISKEIEI